MEQIIDYIFFAIVLTVVISLVKFFFDNQARGKAHQIAAISAAILTVVFWYFGAGFYKLILVSFAVFGFFDFIGRYFEQYFYIAFAKVHALIRYLFAKVKQLVFSLIQKIKNK